MNPKAILYILLSLSLSTAYGQYKNEDYVKVAEPFTVINDVSISFNPILGDNGTTLWFSRTDHEDNIGGEDDQDIWFSRYNEGAWSEPTNQLNGLNTDKQDLVVGQSENTILYLVRYNRGEESDLTSIEAHRKKGEQYHFSHMIKLPNLNIKGSFFGFYVARDESYVIVSMKGDYSFGKEDLYICKKVDGEWTTPIHMGARINTAGFEMSPYVSKDEKHLYFSSEGHKGFGNGDIFVATRLDDTWQNWSKPVNIGPNINTAGFEAYFCLNETLDEAYFFSDKDRSAGMIYRIPYNADPKVDQLSAHQTASGFIRFKELPSMNVKLNLMDENDEVVQSIVTNEDGYFNLQAFLPDKNYKIAVDGDARTELDDAEIFLTNDLGDKMVFMNEDELGIFGFKVISGERVSKLDDFEEMARRGKVVDKPTKISGKVSSYGTLSEKVPLKIMNEANEVVKTIETDEDGYFTFSTDAADKRYFLSIDKDITGLVDVYEVFLTNDNPEEDIVVSKTDKHLFEFSSLLNGGSAGLKLMDERDFGIPQKFFEDFGMVPSMRDQRLSGFLKHGALPTINAEIMLMDENDKLIGTAMTDSSGHFSFSADLVEGNYELKLTEEQNQALNQSEIYLARNPDDVLFYLNDNRNGVFAFKKLAKNKLMTLHSLRTQAENGMVVNEEVTTLKGKFSYAKLPQKGVTLRLMDEDDNLIQETQVNKEGEFEFDRYTTDKNYFISVESEGLSDIYEIYLTGQNKNVLVNRTNKYVFAFKVLPSQDILLTQAFESDQELRLPSSHTAQKHAMGDGVGDTKRSYHEFDIERLSKSGYLSLNRIVKEVNEGYQVVMRLYIELNENTTKVNLQTISTEDIDPVLDRLVQLGVERKRIEVRSSASDQVLLIVK